MTRSPLAPAAFPDLPAVAGVHLATACSGMRYAGRDDLLLAAFATGTVAAGVFTTNAVVGHPVTWCRARIGAGKARALVVNAGNANVFNGAAGDDAVAAMAKAAADALQCPTDEVFVASTGVIGMPLDAEPLAGCLQRMAGVLAPGGVERAAAAIMTTDTFAKGAGAQVVIDGVPVTLVGIAKGSGMIAPNMATMLAYLFTDARIAPDLLDELLRRAVDRSFHSITVDGDTSTSDMVMAFASGAAGHPPLTSAADPSAPAFADALEAVCADLARQVVRDGEGAGKFITIRIDGARDDASARLIGLAVGNSPLVKTAIAGEDANWGRIAMAVGKSGQPVDVAALRIAFGGHVVAANGAVVPGLDEAPIAEHLRGQAIEIAVTVGAGPGQAVIWTCDLTHGYIDINADYRS
ncbi:MAG: bifunctional glutamate N-acetyltransferase/amino-acid acetyltransferase ArgJ [Geminicoccaceae bacterium]